MPKCRPTLRVGLTAAAIAALVTCGCGSSASTIPDGDPVPPSGLTEITPTPSPTPATKVWLYDDDESGGTGDDGMHMANDRVELTISGASHPNSTLLPVRCGGPDSSIEPYMSYSVSSFTAFDATFALPSEVPDTVEVDLDVAVGKKSHHYHLDRASAQKVHLDVTGASVLRITGETTVGPCYQSVGFVVGVDAALSE